MTKLVDIRNEDVLQKADIICLNETHMSQNEELTCEMMNITENCIIFQKDRNRNSGGVAVIVNNRLYIPINTHWEVVAVQICTPIELILISSYQPPSTPISQYIQMKCQKSFHCLMI